MGDKRDVGRPTGYRPEFCDTVMNADPIRAAGATDQAIADHLGVSRMTINRWRDEHDDFRTACEQAKRVADDKVEASLFARATGYNNPNAVKIFMPQGAEAPVYAPFTEHYPPDVGAAFNWLKNRKPHEWRDRVEHTGEGGGPVQVQPALDPLEQARLIGFALAAAAARLTDAARAPVIDLKVSDADSPTGEAVVSAKATNPKGRSK